MITDQERRRKYQRSHFIFLRFRFLLTPVATLKMEYYLTHNMYVEFLDIYVFGFRVARIQK